jgi:hypothetical protein
MISLSILFIERRRKVLFRKFQPSVFHLFCNFLSPPISFFVLLYACVIAEGLISPTFSDISLLKADVYSFERNIIIDVVMRTAEEVFMPLTVGGGIKTIDDIRDLLKAGCAKFL